MYLRIALIIIPFHLTLINLAPFFLEIGTASARYDKPLRLIRPTNNFFKVSLACYMNFSVCKLSDPLIRNDAPVCGFNAISTFLKFLSKEKQQILTSKWWVHQRVFCQLITIKKDRFFGSETCSQGCYWFSQIFSLHLPGEDVAGKGFSFHGNARKYGLNNSCRQLPIAMHHSLQVHK